MGLLLIFKAWDLDFGGIFCDGLQNVSLFWIDFRVLANGVYGICTPGNDFFFFRLSGMRV